MVLLCRGAELVLQTPLERIEPALPQLPVGLEPGVELGQRLGVEGVDPALGLGVRDDETGITQHAQVLRGARLAEPDDVDQLTDGPRPFAQQGDHLAPVGIG